jgi:ABC-type multidrug transport system ATPase subunit
MVEPHGRISIAHTALRRGRRQVLEAAEFNLPASGLVGLIGANGAGKSTLLLALADLLTAASGRLTITAADPPATSILLQAGALPRWASVRRAAALYGADIDQLADGFPALRLAALANRKISELSGGDVQALSFATVVHGDRGMILLDEPFSHMDIARRRAAMDIVTARRNALVMMSAQTAADLAECDWYLVIRDGRYVFCGPRDDLLADVVATTQSMTERLEARLIRLLGYEPARVS